MPTTQYIYGIFKFDFYRMARILNSSGEESESPAPSPPPQRRQRRRQRSRSPRRARDQARDLGLSEAQTAAIREIMRAQPAPQPVLHAQQALPAPQPVVPAAQPAVEQPAQVPRGGRGGRGGRGRGRGQQGGGPWVIWGMRLPSPPPYTPYCRRHGLPNCQNCIYYNPVEES